MTSKIDDGGAAYPMPDQRDPVTGAGIMQGSSGLTKRDYFAAAALTGICANSYTPWSPNVADITDDQIVKAALDLADALIAASKEADHA